MATYQVHGTIRSHPAPQDWEPILTTKDLVEATRVVHETEGTFWRRLLEDGQAMLPRVCQGSAPDLLQLGRGHRYADY
ncbi:hypothetical protein [Streptomyces sp. NPDC047829]|uniref:hypothetical protein n=1 Tax=Streptomyces sp. NPDC047829 TaxID=3154609 RepID=UPI0033C22A3D